MNDLKREKNFKITPSETELKVNTRFFNENVINFNNFQIFFYWLSCWFGLIHTVMLMLMLIMLP